jgi:hypothetical protein
MQIFFINDLYKKKDVISKERFNLIFLSQRLLSTIYIAVIIWVYTLKQIRTTSF